MTSLAKQLPLTILAVILACAIVVGAALIGYQSVRADTGSGSGSGSSAYVVDTQGGTVVIPPVAVPDKPILQEVQDDISDVKDAKKKGWFPALLVAAYALVRLLGRLGKEVKWLSWLDGGRPAMVVAGATVVLTAAVDALVAGGNPLNIAVAAGIALVGYLGTPPKVPA